MPNLRSSIDVSRSVTSRNEQTGQSFVDNFAYNFTLTYGTRKIFGSVYSFCISVYDRSNFYGTNNQRSDKLIWKADHSI